MYDIIFSFVVSAIIAFAVSAFYLKVVQKRRDKTKVDFVFNGSSDLPPARNPPPPPVEHVHVVKFADLVPIPVFVIGSRSRTGEVTIKYYTEDAAVAREYADSILHKVTVIAGFKTPDGKLLKVNTSELLTKVSS